MSSAMRGATHDRATNQRPSYEPTWAAETFIVPLLKRKIAELVQLHRNTGSKTTTALDVGCGAQPFRHLLEESGHAYRSLDVTQNKAGTVDWLVAIDGSMPEEILRHRFDFILCTEVLEHVANWEAAWKNLSALLAPEGRLMITCPHVYPLHEEPYDFWRPTPHAIQSFAEKNGLEVEFLEAAGTGREALGTMLSITYICSQNRKLTSRVKSWLGQRFRNFAMWALTNDTLLRGIEVRSPFFLSNVAVLKKPAVTSGDDLKPIKNLLQTFPGQLVRTENSEAVLSVK